MLRRYRSLKKIVYAASILFTTIILYAGTSSNDYPEGRSREWIIPNAARDMYHMDAALQEPLHRLPLGPFEDHPVSIVVETLQMQIPTFEHTGSDEPSNVVPSALPKPAALAPAAAHPLKEASAGHPSAAVAQEIHPAPPVPIPFGQIAPATKYNSSAPSNQTKSHAAIPSQNLAGNTPAPVVPNPQPPQNAPAPPHPLIPHPPAKPLPNFNKTMTEMARRLNHTKSHCDKFKVPNQIDSDIYHLLEFNMSYCKIPKSGCTYWEQVISFLNKPVHELSYLGIKMPFQISKFDIRYTSHFNLPRRDFKKDEDKTEIMKTTRVLFVRHPLERLWSCYVEKFYLIDFWTTAAMSMKTAGADRKCPKSVTFREFIDFSLPLFNENWAPMTELCNPCVFQPHIIGHVETIREDTYYTLKKIKQDWIFTEHDKFSREENQMLDMAIYNYQIHSINWYSFYHKCLSQKELATKLWEVFKKVGYLSSHAAVPADLHDYNQTTIIKELKLQFRKYPLGPANGRAQQLKMMKRDFESLPKPTMAKILEKYAMDFQLFGFSTQLPSA